MSRGFDSRVVYFWARPAALHHRTPKLRAEDGLALLERIAILWYRVPARRTRSLGRDVEQQRSIEEAAALLEDTVNSLRRCPPDQMDASMRQDLMDLRPYLDAAMEALEDIERRRELTDRERNLQRAFKMLLEVRRRPG